jgi:hypothetical protein
MAVVKNKRNMSIIREAIGLNAIVSLKNGEIVNGFVKDSTKGIVTVVESDNSKSYILESDISLVRVPSGSLIKQNKNIPGGDFDENEYYSSAGLTTMNEHIISRKEPPQVEFSMMGGNAQDAATAVKFERKTDKNDSFKE